MAFEPPVDLVALCTQVGPSAGGNFLDAPLGVGRREATAQGIRVMRERVMSFLANRSRAAHLRVCCPLLLEERNIFY